MKEGWTELRKARQKAGLSQQELAVKAGMSISQVSEFERGSRNPLNMTAGNLLELADVLNVDPIALMGGRRKGKETK